MYDNELLTSLLDMADDAALYLAKKSLNNYELREAMETERVPEGVRLGAWEIILSEDEGRTFSIRETKTGKVVISDFAFYDAAHRIVYLLNHGHHHRSPAIQKMVLINDEYTRARADAYFYGRRSAAYEAKGNFHRAFVAEDRQLEAERRARELRIALGV